MVFSIFPIQSDLTPWFDIGLSILLIAGIIYTCIRMKFSTKIIVTVILFILAFVITGIFDLVIVRGITMVFALVYCVYVSLFLTTPEKELELRYHKKVSKKENSLTVSEVDTLIQKLQEAVSALSMTQTGALITIERSDDLSSYMQTSGTKVNAPVTPELLETIFYKGTPLHDGATIIRGNMVISSAVFYQPTQKPLNGKYGSRHRAAIGFSEICDALTIVVSEETGKISFAYKGELIPVPMSRFEALFKEYYEKK